MQLRASSWRQVRPGRGRGRGDFLPRIGQALEDLVELGVERWRVEAISLQRRLALSVMS